MDEDEDKSSRGSKRDCKGPCRIVCGKTGKIMDLSMERTQYGRENLRRCFRLRRRRISCLQLRRRKKIWRATKIMDRLICGDVGYGKTEIAIRAAFKAVQENKQVVYLVPTTILAQQHYNTFVQRMKEFPVRVDLMCRFRTPAQHGKKTN